MIHRILTVLGQAPWTIKDPGSGAAIRPTQWSMISIVTGASGETNTLPSPTKEGQVLVLVMKTDGGGDRVITAAAAINQTGNTVITLNDAGDFVMLMSKPYGSGFRWQVVVNDGATLS